MQRTKKAVLGFATALTMATAASGLAVATAYADTGAATATVQDPGNCAYRVSGPTRTDWGYRYVVGNRCASARPMQLTYPRTHCVWVNPGDSAPFLLSANVSNWTVGTC